MLPEGFPFHQFNFSIALPYKFKRILANFSCSSHLLNIKQGRHLRIDRENRVCRYCLQRHVFIIENEIYCLTVHCIKVSETHICLKLLNLVTVNLYLSTLCVILNLRRYLWYQSFCFLYLRSERHMSK